MAASEDYLHAALESALDSSRRIRSLQFASRTAFARAALEPAESFESRLIRDGEPYELALFAANNSSAGRYGTSARADAGELTANDFEPEGRWTATKRAGPRRAALPPRASPLKGRAGASSSDDPERCLNAAARLVDAYPLPRAQEHIHALLSQLEGVLASISSSEDALKKPKATTKGPAQDEATTRALELAEALKVEELELIALQEIKDTAKRESENLEAQLRKKRLMAAKKAAAQQRQQDDDDNNNSDTQDTVAAAAAASDPFKKSDLLERNAAATSRAAAAAAAASAATKKAAASPQKGSPAASAAPPRTTKASSPATRSSPAQTTTPRKSGAAAGTSSRETTPKAQTRSSARLAGSPAPVATSPGQQLKKRSSQQQQQQAAEASMPLEDLNVVTARIWRGCADFLKPWTGRVEGLGDDFGSSPEYFNKTLSLLFSIVSAPVQTEPPSPHSASSYLTPSESGTATADDESSLSSLAPNNSMACALLALLLAHQSGTPLPPSLAGEGNLTLVMREPPMPSSLAGPGAQAPLPARKKDGMLLMDALKGRLATYARAKGWQDDLGTKAIYAMVAKKVCRIDRRAKEGALVGFC